MVVCGHDFKQLHTLLCTVPGYDASAATDKQRGYASTIAVEEIVWYNPSSMQLEEFEAVSCVSGNTHRRLVCIAFW